MKAINEPLRLSLKATGTGSGITTFALTVSQDTNLEIKGDGMFYNEVSGINVLSNQRDCKTGAVRTFYLKLNSGTSELIIINGRRVVTQFNNYVTTVNSPIFNFNLSVLPRGLTKLNLNLGENEITGNLYSLPYGLTTFYCYGSNTITGNLYSLPYGLTAFYCGGSNTITGNLSSLPAAMIEFNHQGTSVLTGDLSSLPAGMTYFNCLDNNTITGNLSSLPAGITTFYCYGANTITGNLSSLPAGITTFYCPGFNTITGNLSSLPAAMRAFYCGGSNTITGNLSSLKAGMTTFNIEGSNTITGNLSSLPAAMTTFYCLGNNTVDGYDGKDWNDALNSFVFMPITGGGLGAVKCANLIIDLDSSSPWAGANKTLNLKGANASPYPSTALTSAIASLTAKGVTISTN